MIANLLVYGLPCLITLIFTTLRTWNIFREMRESSDHCPSIGQVVSTIGLYVVAFIPVVNIFAAGVFTVGASHEYQFEIEDFFDRPICFWRSK